MQFSCFVLAKLDLKVCSKHLDAEQSIQGSISRKKAGFDFFEYSQALLIATVLAIRTLL